MYIDSSEDEFSYGIQILYPWDISNRGTSIDIPCVEFLNLCGVPKSTQVP